MKLFTIIALLIPAFSAPADDMPTWQELSARLFIHAAIIWQPPANRLPPRLWVYQRQLPHIFPPTVISNAIVLGSLQSKGFPKISTNDFFIAEDKGPDYPGPILTVFGIIPGDANLYYAVPNNNVGSATDVPDDETVTARAWKCAAQLGLDPARMVPEKPFTHRCDVDGPAVGPICGRGIFLSRQLDGVSFFSANNEGDSAEGFSLELGSHGKIKGFSLRWSDLKRFASHKTASRQDIIQCIRAHKTTVLPGPDEENYFARLRKLATAKKLTVTNITPYYGEGIMGQAPTNDAPCQFATPLAELDAVADFGDSTTSVTLVSPVIDSEVHRLLRN